ncbi:cytochrome b561 and DOMON domain-containing protein At5g47530 [Carica papaya]|uniref:cytochrome b561 and DOMON domain-containing protein At5g47530 n=1 Tax=Carica papaya TaxID=3649 RepID=UPI000B8D1896|nr:cytochrome b561 and DOMON domain-containing protein At5g47530 [Carica papaya]
MAKLLYQLLLCFSFLLCMIFSSSAQTCSSRVFSNNQVFKSCNDLPVLNSFLHYNYDSSSGKLQIAYRHTGITSRRWVAWAINPKSGGMLGSQALVAFQKTDGSMTAYGSPIDSYQTTLKNGSLSFGVSDLSATFENNEITIFATLSLDGKTETLNQVWQDGLLQGDAPQMHDTNGDNVKSMSTLNLVSGESGTVGGNSKIKKRNIHGVLNVVSWGIMMPIGAIIARYLKVFKSADPAWFYLHVFCQSSAYVIGVSGWATGLKLGSESSGIQYNPHRAIGIILFCLGTLQVFALLLRPKPDHKYRFYWNIYHHSVGYLVIILSIVNIFKGFDILKPEKKWKTAYIAVIVVLAIKAVSLEAYTWFVVMKRRKSENEAAKMPHARNEANGYGQQQHV